ncbi:hypothetical protein BHYA_0005g00170 [Botrytis hyacinthi]|uniref:Uncharacterized protein n=1 Tax=Botrytis hyacinthi TaxID=278943 RepID=A0A4Z1H5K3_9HELO|nr:hypothetical protein BHYA_0005g00170 [Botrytis hyacinthi]
MLVLALGLYLGQFGTAEPNGTKYVILLYTIGLVLFVGAYSIAQSFDIEEVHSEIVIINGYMAECKASASNCADHDEDKSWESDPLLKQAETIGETSLATTEVIGSDSSTASRPERRRKD